MGKTKRQIYLKTIQGGINAMPAPTNDFEIRTTSLDVLLGKLIDGEPALVIHPRCKTLIKGLAGAHHFRRVQVANEDRHKDKAASQIAEMG